MTDVTGSDDNHPTDLSRRQNLRTPRAAAVAGIAFAVLLTIAIVLVRLAVPADPADAGTWLTDTDRLFATVFLGSGLLFIAMLFCSGAIAGGLVFTASGHPTPEVWSFGRRASHTLLTVYAMRMAAVFTISTTTIATRLGLAPRWLGALGLGTGVVLLFGSGVVPWIEVLFPAWVFILSLHILVVSFRAPDDQRFDARG